MKSLLRKLYREEEGQTLVEYALIIALVAIAVITAISFLGKRVGNTYSNVSSSIN